MKVKTYFNSAIIGNSRILACVSDKGEIVRFFWPNIDYLQHIEKLVMGLFPTDRKSGASWLGEGKWNACQEYIDDSNVLKTTYSNDEIGMDAEQVDLVLPGADVLIRHYEIKNRGLEAKETGFIVYSSFTTSNQDIRGSLFDFDNEALIHYRHGSYISISGDRDVYQFQLGNNAYEAANNAGLYGADSIGMMADAAISWKLGEIRPGETKSFTFYICVSSTLQGVKELAGGTRKYNWHEKYNLTLDYWKGFFNNAKRVNTGIKKIDTLYKRSLMVFKLMQNESTGGLLAAPEVDEHFTRCGRYGYCWGRDAAFITEAMDRCGLQDAVDKFFDWVARVQDAGGFWHQRYYLDGNLAPSWGLQVDETGTLIWGMLQHYKIRNDKSFLDKMWPSVERGVEFLVSFIDSETGLPCPSYDLWEERAGEHTYSSAAVLAGISAGIEIAEILGLPEKITCKWEETAKQIEEAIVKVLWSDKHGRFLRSVRTKLNPWGAEYSENKTLIKVNPKGYYRDVTLEDSTVDVSLLGVCVPFDIFSEDNPMVESTARAIEQALEFDEAGGIGRYENDSYIGGNPWVVATLWIALYHIRKKEYQKAREYLNWAVNSATGLGFLPEQADRHTGRPAWVIPLTWSHAMFVLCFTVDEHFLSTISY